MVAHAKKRYAVTDRKIAKAIKDMRRKGLNINPQTVAKYAGVPAKPPTTTATFSTKSMPNRPRPPLHPRPQHPKRAPKHTWVTVLHTP